ncbi:MAG TPA: hypothetical protein VMT18_16090 [Planctomycetota bacterium]|nr:hypothetical protein [Planctomycetota bacterium]
MLAVCLLAVFQSAPASGAVELVWRPAPGSELERRVDFELHGGLDDPHGWLGMFGLAGLTDVLVVGRLRVIDTIVDVEGGRPLELERELLALDTLWNGLAERQVAPDHVGCTLRYVWDPETGAFERAWSRRPPRALEPPSLREDLDLRALLPDHAVRVGELWHVPVHSVAPLLVPAGSLHVDGELGRDWGFEGLAQAFDIERVQRIRDGRVECLFARVEGDLAVVEFGWTWWGSVDPFLTPQPDAWFAPCVRYAPDGITLDLDARAWGRMTWDLAANHARELELSAEMDGTLGGWPFRARGTWWYEIEAH